MKFWTLPHQVEWLKHTCSQRLAEGTDKELYFQIGFFTNSYAIVEMRISLMLAKATGITQLQSFDLLTRGMDVRVKIERLKRACENGPAIGPNLNHRLNIMNDIMRVLRNKVAHTYLATADGGDLIHFSTLAEMPQFVEKRHADSRVQTQLSQYATRAAR